MKGAERGNQLKFEANSAVQAQLATLPPSDRARAQRVLTRLAENPNSSTPIKTRMSADGDLWTVRISPQMRALVRIEGEKVTVLAIARYEELAQYRLGD